MTTEERLDTLERNLAAANSALSRAEHRNGWLLSVVALTVGGLLIWALTANTATAQAQAAGFVQKEIRANKFILEDEKGKSRAMLGVGKSGPGLTLSDENGKIAAVLGAGQSGQVLILYDENGKSAAALRVIEGSPGLDLSDENGKTRAALDVGKSGPGLNLFDENGKTRAALGAGQTTTPNGKVIIYPEASVRLFGPDGNMLWSAP